MMNQMMNQMMNHDESNDESDNDEFKKIQVEESISNDDLETEESEMEESAS